MRKPALVTSYWRDGSPISAFARLDYFGTDLMLVENFRWEEWGGHSSRLMLCEIGQVLSREREAY